MMCSDDGKHDSEENTGEPDKNSHPHGIAYRVAEFGLYAIFISGDIYEWWEDHRIIALIVAVAALGFLLVIDKGFSARTITRTLIGASLMATAAYFVVPKTIVPEVEISGSLLPSNDPTPANSCDNAPLPANALKILIGDNTAALASDGKITAIRIGSCPVLSMERKADKISVSVSLYDAGGKLIASTTDGVVRAITGENVRLRRNGDLSTIIVEDGDRKELLNVRYLNPTTVKARGVFGCPGHKPVTVKDGQTIPGMLFSGNCGTNLGVTFITIK